MKSWPKYPVIYEINTCVWLHELSLKHNRQIKLGNVPSAEWDCLGSPGIDAVWFMGVWERSPAGKKIARANQELMSEFKKVLPDFSEKDLAGSAYCIRNYVVDSDIGGPEGLANARRELARRGIRLILDFVPNHVAPDHPWVTSHPEYFIRGSEEDIQRDPASYIKSGNNIIALGRDPYFPAWPDVVQLNAFSPGLRKAVMETVSGIAEQCDGIRCDMAMLMMNSIFEKTWGAPAGEKPAGDYWVNLITEIKNKAPGFLFIAEAYWNLEWELQQQGFDFCYDKKLYDRMEHGSVEDIRLHLLADMSYQDRLIRFIENHDEPRAASSFSFEKGKMAAVVFSTLPGARLFHEGQFEWLKTKVPVFLNRRPDVNSDNSSVQRAELKSFYATLLSGIDHDVFRNGIWQLCEVRGWPENSSCGNLLAWTWRNDQDRYLIIINFSSSESQGMVKLPWNDFGGKTLRLNDALNSIVYERAGNEIADNGLYADLKPWSCHFFKIEVN